MSTPLSITGTVHKIFDTQVISDRFRKRIVVIKKPSYQDNFDYIPFEFKQDDVTLLDKFNPGEEVEVYFNLRGREWNSKYLGSNEGWKIKNIVREEPEKLQVDELTANDDLPF